MAMLVYLGAYERMSATEKARSGVDPVPLRIR